MSNEKNTSFEETIYSTSASGESAQSKNPYPAAEVIPLGCEGFTDNSKLSSEKSEDSSVESYIPSQQSEKSVDAQASSAETSHPSVAEAKEGKPQTAEPAPEPTVYFEDLALSDDVLDALWDMRFEKCTPVQAQCIPHILEGKDMIGIAQTGTGKTAAFLLPMLTLLHKEPHPADAVNCLILSPTRELAQQIDQALQGFAYYTKTNSVAVYGGNDGIRFEQERKAFSQGADIIVATPGRLISHLQLGNLDLSRTTHIILDEADRMLDMGFFDDIKTIMKQLPEHKQTILFSATMPPEIAKMAREMMHNPVEVKIAVSKPAEKIDQSVYVCRDSDKTPILKHIFTQQPPERVIVFVSSKQRVKELNVILKRKGYNCAAMHSDLDQAERDVVMLGFKQRNIDMLIATDIVSRGIDIDDIQMVINYDAPRDPEDYVHRIGRTARAGREGRAITLIGEKDRYPLSKIEKLLEKKITRNPLPEGCLPPEEPTSHEGRGKHRRGGNHGGRGNSDNRGRGRGGKSHAGSNNNRSQSKSSPTENSKQGQSTNRQRRHHRRPNQDKSNSSNNSTANQA